MMVKTHSGHIYVQKKNATQILSIVHYKQVCIPTEQTVEYAYLTNMWQNCCMLSRLIKHVQVNVCFIQANGIRT